MRTLLTIAIDKTLKQILNELRDRFAERYSDRLV